MQKSLFKDYIIYNAQDFQKYLNTFIRDGVLTDPNITSNNKVVSAESFTALMQGMVKELDNKNVSIDTDTLTYTTHTLKLTSTFDTAIDYKETVKNRTEPDIGYEEIKEAVEAKNNTDTYTKEYILSSIEYAGDTLTNQDTDIRQRSYLTGSTGYHIEEKDNYFIHKASLNYPLIYDDVIHYYPTAQQMQEEASDKINDLLIKKTRSSNEKELFNAKSSMLSTLGDTYGYVEESFEDIDPGTEEVINNTTYRTITLPNTIIIAAIVYINNLYCKTYTTDTETNSIRVGVKYPALSEDLKPLDTRQLFKIKIIYREN